MILGLLVLGALLAMTIAVLVFPALSSSPDSRWIAAAVGGLAVFGFSLALAGTIRQTILGLPRARVSTDGISIGLGGIPWRSVEWVSAGRLMGQRWLLVETAHRAIAGLPWYDDLALRLMPRYPDGSRPIWINEQQLDTDVASALSVVPVDRLR